MAKLNLRQSALNDLTGIWEYTFDRWSRDQANKYYETLRHACLKIAQNPEIGKEYHSIKAGLKGYRINKHIIFYQEGSSKSIDILRILHERMDLKRHL